MSSKPPSLDCIFFNLILHENEVKVIPTSSPNIIDDDIPDLCGRKQIDGVVTYMDDAHMESEFDIIHKSFSK